MEHVCGVCGKHEPCQQENLATIADLKGRLDVTGELLKKGAKLIEEWVENASVQIFAASPKRKQS